MQGLLRQRGQEKWGQACDLRFYLTVVGVAEWRRLESAGAMARKARAEVEGGLYHASRGNNRQTIFKCKDDFQKFLSQLEIQKHKLSHFLHAYCLMSLTFIC